MSTLAVAGVSGGGRRRIFSEHDLNVGQTFQNSYEATKYRAEAILLDYALEGGKVYVYRTGNVSGDLRRGKFQRNGAQNRLIQLVRACVKVGRVPLGLDEQVNLNPVDVVAEGMAKIAFSSSARPGIYHIDSPNYIRLTSVFECLERLGFKFARTNHESLKEMFSEVISPSDPDIALGVFWSSRPSRNVEFECSSTLELLESLGTVMPKLSEQWIESFTRLLVQNKVLTHSDPNVVHIDRFMRSRIFSIPSAKSKRREGYSAANL